jgi:hypothetical protein
MLILNFLCPRLFLSERQLATSETAAVALPTHGTAGTLAIGLLKPENGR